MDNEKEEMTTKFERLKSSENIRSDPDGKTDDLANDNDVDEESLSLQFEMVPRLNEEKNKFCDVRVEKRGGKSPLPEEANLIA